MCVNMHMYTFYGAPEQASHACLCRVNSAKRLRHLFEQIDTDHDGKFNATDFRFFLHKSSTRLEKMTQVCHFLSNLCASMSHLVCIRLHQHQIYTAHSEMLHA